METLSSSCTEEEAKDFAFQHYFVISSIFLSRLDETTHARVQGWVADVLPLTDWSQGITAILHEKTGEHKKKAWSKQLEDVWQRHRTQHYQFSLFDTGESE